MEGPVQQQGPWVEGCHKHQWEGGYHMLQANAQFKVALTLQAAFFRVVYYADICVSCDRECRETLPMQSVSDQLKVLALQGSFEWLSASS